MLRRICRFEDNDLDLTAGLIVFLGECAAKELAFWYELSLPAYQFPQAVRLVIAIMTMGLVHTHHIHAALELGT